jgi:hypothetical protein
MDIPTSWTDLGMNWEIGGSPDVRAVRIAPYDPYFVAVAEAIKERAVAENVDNQLDPMLITPSPLYDANKYAIAIQEGLDIIIPKYVETPPDTFWTESSLLAAIGAPSRIGVNEYMTSEWLMQQYEMINELLIRSSLLVYEGRGNNATRKTGDAFLFLADAVADYNSSSFSSSGGSSNVLYGEFIGSDWRIRGYRGNVLVSAPVSRPITDGTTVDIYCNFQGGGYFIPIDFAQEKLVYYLTNSGFVWNEVGGIVDLGIILSAPDTVTESMFPESQTPWNRNQHRFIVASYEEPSLKFKR